MAKLFNLARMSTATTGTGTLTLGAAISGFLSFANAGVSDGDTVDYAINDPGTGPTASEIGTGTYSASGPTLTRTVTKSTNSNSAINLSGGAHVFISPRAETLADTAKAADNLAINSGIDISQELGTTGATLTNNTAKYIVDCFEAMYNHAAATAVVTSAQLAAASFPSPLSGFLFGHQIKATTAITSPASGDFAKHRQQIEGYRIAHLGWGATGAAATVVAFELYSTASGTAFVKLSNSDQSRCYYHEITVSAGWNFYAFSVAGDTSGTWQATTSAGLVVEVFVSGEETTPASSLDAWGSTNKVQTTNSTNLLGTNNNLTILTGVFVAGGTALPVATDLPLLMRCAPEEKRHCLRYYLTFGGASAYETVALTWINSTTTSLTIVQFPEEMRVAPTLSASAASDWSPDGGDTAGSSIAAGSPTPRVCDVHLIGSGYTVGPGSFTAKNTTAARLNFNARL